ncbi:hypothetical protein OC834_001465 [Tilletia horrida]|uniref:HD/PDEase domain-containing protein n=1 Tax=Tilletia horrida TaxID=155126 RepID=A0AAN6GHV0_9BASI|nr:hypothetical protein OC834_001465 [Tilletia horrida]KAK0538432.1 hypothetical protein OC842_001308 [Tilletia horrida]KAK0541263.1 hypothetical protein OC835_000247 [Tilletia horrida]KAK0563662.1 hypothetical protein OC844_002110 [Tilletia horrida]
MSVAARVELRDEILYAAEQFVKEKFRHHDPSHDWHHVHRVRQLALHIGTDPTLPRPPDALILELGALFHDLCDRKYLPTETSAQSSSAKAVLQPFFDGLGASGRSAKSGEEGQGEEEEVAGQVGAASIEQVLTPTARATIERIVDNVSWSKDARRRKERAEASARGEDPREINAGREGEQIDWEESCVEFWCVSDADRLDAIGSIGILRCAAFSAIKNRPLHIPPANPQGDSRPPAEQGEGYNGSCIAHFHEKLLLIRGDRLRTEAARAEAERRQASMESFLNELDLEWLVGSQGEQMFRMGQDMADVEAATQELELARGSP